jgi:hypothetical protein
MKLLYLLPHIISSVAPGDSQSKNDYLHFTDEKREAERGGGLTRKKLHSELTAERAGPPCGLARGM